MNRWRILIYAAAIVAVVLAGFACAVAGIWACNPPPLAGDEFWTRRERLFEALTLTLSGGYRACFEAAGSGPALLHVAGWTPAAAALLAAAAVVWETVGRRARLFALRTRGDHAIIAGSRSVTAELGRRERRLGPIVHIATTDDEATVLSRAHPFREVGLLTDRTKAGVVVERLGGRRARFLAAATGSDLANLAIAEAAIRLQPRAELLLRLEQPSVRALGSESLRRLARDAGVPATVVSLNQLQIRRGVALAMPGRYVLDGAARHHIVLCGSGPALQEAAFHVARQGYGLERSKPLITVIRTGHSDFAAGAIERLTGAEGAVTVSLASVDATDTVAVERAMSGAVLNSGAPSSVHCIAGDPAEAEQMARRWEQVLLDLDQPVPPIVVYGDGQMTGRTGMIRHAAAVDLADARDVALKMDLRAQAAHDRYLDGQRRTQGEAFGSAPAEVEWSILKDGFQEDNRNAADHVEYKLALAGCAVGEGKGPSAKLTQADIEALSPVEHGRWVASRTVAGYRWAEKRDEPKLLHPDLVPYEALTEDAKRKDRDNVAGVPGLLALGNERVVREIAVGAIPATDASTDLGAIVEALADWAARHPERLPLVRLPLDGEAPVALAERLTRAGFAIEIVQDRPIFAILQPKHAANLMQRAADVLTQAWRIRTVEPERTARDAIVASCPILVDADGGLHAQALA